MSIVLQHLQNTIGQRENRLWGGYVNMLKTLESVFLSPKHWVLEFLQNAEDASAKRISIHLGQDSLQILNDGNVFSDDDFYAICDVNSKKLPSLGFRGYIGIGFKSIFRITDCVNVHSGNFHFRFDKKDWDDSKREGIPISNWPWEILPIETNPVGLQGDHTTRFFVPLESMKGKEILEEIGKFLASYNFPKEAILLLENVEIIEVQTPQLSFTITKETEESETIPIGKKERVLVKKQVNGQQHPEEAHYLVFRKTVGVPPDIRMDEETERVRRSEISEREIGLVFGLDSEKSLQSLSGKLAGVYSFLPVEGEQTGLPFGIFGDFIPQLGRDLINYGAKWNHWLCDEVVDFFKQVVYEVFSPHPVWTFFPAELLTAHNITSGPGEEFWKTKLRDPIEHFIEAGTLFPDEDGKSRRLDELADVADKVAQVIGKDTLKTHIGKEIVHDSIRDELRSKIEFVDDIYDLLYKEELLEALKEQPEKLTGLYRLIADLSSYQVGGRQRRDTPLSQVPFVLAEDDKFYPPSEVETLETDADHAPEFLKTIIATEKKLLHPNIAKYPEAVNELIRCGLESTNTQSVLEKLEQQINRVGDVQSCPKAWKYPDNLIEATLFLISEKKTSRIERPVAHDGTLQVPGNLFVPEASLNWMPLWGFHLLPGFLPLHKGYFDEQLLERYGLQVEEVRQCFEELGVHGFHRDKDKSLIETAAYAVVRKKLSGEGHSVADVTERHKLGYDLQCQGHCGKVFEVKGMADSRDVLLEESEVSAAQQKEDDYILICVYNLPTTPDPDRGTGYKEIPNPQSIWEPVEKARVPKDKWIRI